MPTKTASPVFDLLLLSLRLDSSEFVIQEAEQIIQAREIEWVDLLEKAKTHCINQQLEKLLNGLSSGLVPDYVKERLSNANRENLLRQLRSIAEFFQIKQSFDKQQIQAIPYKGFWLAEVMYGNIAGREAYDVDLFIDVKDLEKIKTIMVGEGYVNTSLLAQLTDEYIINELCEYNFEKFENETRIFHFEFHWRSSLNFFRMDISLDDLRSQVVTGKIQNRELQLFSPAANLLLTIMHHGGKRTISSAKAGL
jgi:hypothetical protein